MAQVLIVGVARSGTTWVGQTLGRTQGVHYVHEPDGDHDAFAFRARRGFAANPVLRPGESYAEWERLWRGVFAGGRPSPALRARAARYLYAKTPVADRWDAWLGGRTSPRLRLVAALAAPRVGSGSEAVVAKSVRAAFAVEWIAARFEPRVLVVERNPLNVLSSWITLDFLNDARQLRTLADTAQRSWGIEAPSESAPRLVQQAFSVGVLMSALREASDRHPDWQVVRHEDLCIEPVRKYRALAERLGLVWSDGAAAFLEESDREGEGYETRRPTSLQPERWRDLLDPAQVTTIQETLAVFPYALVPEM
ncbi:MAG: sulfotransferase [Acidimicrobiia bacterium]